MTDTFATVEDLEARWRGLSAQEQAMGFYERCGYRAAGGGRYLDADIWHRDMARTLPGAGAP